MNTLLESFASATSTDTHQVIDAQEEGLDAAVALAVPARRDAQIDPHQLGEELQGEAAQAVLRAPVQLEQLVAHRLHQLECRRGHKECKSVQSLRLSWN